MLKKFRIPISFTPFFYGIAFGLSAAFFIGGLSVLMYQVSVILTIIFSLAITYDILLLFFVKNQLELFRELPRKLSNNDENKISIGINNKSNIFLNLDVIDEIPHQFQKRDVKFNIQLNPNEIKQFTYQLTPKKRGVYNFGNTNVFLRSKIFLVQYKVVFKGNSDVPVYPSFLQLKKVDFIAFSQKLSHYGIKKIRKIGQSSEFDQIKDYVVGDDFRKINWKATARTNELMINQFQDEKSQSILAVINIGRVMKMPFNGLSLLDYSINSSLSFLNLALKKQDKIGLATFSKDLFDFVAPEKSSKNLQQINEILYQQSYQFAETSYEILHAKLKRLVRQRSFIFLYTNFESLASLEREMPYLKVINKHHRLIVIFFQNEDILKMTQTKAKTIKNIYDKVSAQSILSDKSKMVNLLERNGIHALISLPENLTVNSINKYLEFKSRGLF